MGSNSLLVICTHGTYGRDDDLYGALLASNAALAKGLMVTLLLVDEGVFACKKNQNPLKIALPNSLDELNDFLELGGKLIVENSSLVERGIEKKEIIDGAKIIQIKSIDEIIKKNEVSLTF